MPRLPRVTAAKLLRVLVKIGFVLRRQTGSHAVFKHFDGRMVVVPIHAGDIKIGTLKAILDDAKITTQELIDLL